jgi:hypothetical protein
MTAPQDVLERRRQVLLVRIALQRFALRSDVGTVRASLATPAWRGPALAGVATIAARWLLDRVLEAAGRRMRR